MVNIYIKSFNRPFYLDRCIRSIKFNVSGYDKIIVLDDGSLSIHLERLRQLHPDVEVRCSGADDGKVALLRLQKFRDIAKKYPSALDFWLTELRAEPNAYFLLLEDDAWIVRRIDLPALLQNMESNEAAICKLWWGEQIHRPYKRHTCFSSAAIEYYEPCLETLRETYSVWVVAFALFRRDYWLYCVSAAQRLADEKSQLIAAAEFFAHNPTVTFAKSVERCIYQGWIIPARSTPEYYDRGLIQHVYMDALNNDWYEGVLDPIEGYPYDFSEAYIRHLLLQKLPSEIVGVWEEWRRREVSYLYDA